MKFPFDIVLPAIKLTIGKEKEPVPALAPAPVSSPVPTSPSTLVFDSKDAVIACLTFALMFTVLALLILALAKHSNS